MMLFCTHRSRGNVCLAVAGSVKSSATPPTSKRLPGAGNRSIPKPKKDGVGRCRTEPFDSTKAREPSRRTPIALHDPLAAPVCLKGEWWSRLGLDCVRLPRVCICSGTRATRAVGRRNGTSYPADRSYMLYESNQALRTSVGVLINGPRDFMRSNGSVLYRPTPPYTALQLHHDRSKKPERRH